MADTTSILTTTKKLLGIFEADTSFDTDILIHINSVFSLLHQIGASPLEGVTVGDKTAVWEIYIGDRMGLEMVKTYMYLKVRSWFDPPTTSFALEALRKQIEEFEWRLNVTELKFNPYAYSGLDMSNVYIIDDLGDFPSDAPIGALGFDPDSGKLWRNT